MSAIIICFNERNSSLLFWGDKECKQHCCGLNTIQPHTATHSLPGHGAVGRQSEVKKHMGFSWGELTDKGKNTLTSKGKQGMHPALPISIAGAEQAPGKQGIHHTQRWLGKANAITPNSPHTLSSCKLRVMPPVISLWSPGVGCLASVPS